MRVHYTYNNKTTPINLVALGTEIQESAITSASGVYTGAEWSVGCNTTQKPPCNPDYCTQPCNGLLVLFFTVELSVEDKAILDDIVSHY